MVIPISLQRSIPMVNSHQSSAGISVRVDDMTCGHCAATIKGAIESAIPGSRVTADPQAKLVRVEGASDPARINGIITLAGYTPATAEG
jgi:copper chaperone